RGNLLEERLDPSGLADDHHLSRCVADILEAMWNISRKENVGSRHAFETCVAVLEKILPLSDVERFVLPVMHMARRPAFRPGNTLENHQTSGGFPACNDGSYQIPEDVQGGRRSGLVAERHHKLPQRFGARSCHRGNILVNRCSMQLTGAS